jgi:hypothetical protein
MTPIHSASLARAIAVLAIALVVFGVAPSRTTARPGVARREARRAAAPDPASVRKALAARPLDFAPAPSGFVAHARGMDVRLTADGAALDLASGAACRLSLEGARRIAPAGVDDPATHYNYFVGADRARWRSGVAAVPSVGYANVYPGVDMGFHGTRSAVEYDFCVAPRADVGRIRLRVDGAERLRIDGDGDLVMETAAGEVRQRAPRASQRVGAREVAVPCAFRLLAGRRVAFSIGAYDTSEPLLIDPTFGVTAAAGGRGEDDAFAVVTDRDGNVYVAGDTNGAGFPATNGSAQPRSGGGLFNAFVAKWNGSGALVFATYLGGSFEDGARGVAVDAAGNVYVTGTAYSTDFPTTAGSLAPSPHGEAEAYVAKLSPAGDRLLYSTFLGGSSGDVAAAIAVDAAGSAYVAGSTESADFPATAGTVEASFAGGISDAFVAKLAPDGASLAYATFLGGSDADLARGVAVDADGRAFVVGTTFSADFPATPGALQTQNRGSSDAFVAKLAADGSVLDYATYLGGGGDEALLGGSVAVDAAGSAYVVGDTTSADFPATPGAFRTVLAGGTDAFAAKLDPGGGALVYATFLGGAGEDAAAAVAVDADGNAVVAGTTASTDFPLAGELQPSLGGGPVARRPGGEAWSVNAHGLGANEVWALATDPATSALYAATTHGVFRSSDGGATWEPAGDGLGGELVTAVAAGPDSTLYAAVYHEATASGSLFKSTDGARSWSRVGASAVTLPVVAIAVAPSDPNVVYVAGTAVVGDDSGVFRSSDAGATWSEPTLVGVSLTSLAVDPGRSDTVYAGSFHSNLFKSADGARTWTEQDEGLVNYDVTSIVIDPTNTRRVYAATHSFDIDHGAVFASADAGATWRQSSPMTFVMTALVMDPRRPSTLYAGTFAGLFETADGGRTWRDAGLPNTKVQALALGAGASPTLVAGVAERDDAFLAELAADGSAALYSTYLGGTADDRAFGVALDREGNAVVAGALGSGFFAAASAPAVRLRGGVADAFFARVAKTVAVTGVEVRGAKLVVAGAGFDAGSEILVDGAAVATRPDRRSPRTVLVAPKGGRAVAHGATVEIRVRTSGGAVSAPCAFTR